MMSTARRLHYSYADYLRMLECSGIRLEYADGEVYAMAGGTVAHAALGAATVALLRQALLGRCGVYSSDLKVRVAATNIATFPDASVICGPVETAADDRDAVTNPGLLVEVTSRSTEDYDRGDKLSNYKQLPSLRCVLLVSHRQRAVTMVERDQPEKRGWRERVVRSSERITLSEPRLDLAVDDLYAGVTLDPE